MNISMPILGHEPNDGQNFLACHCFGWARFANQPSNQPRVLFGGIIGTNAKLANWARRGLRRNEWRPNWAIGARPSSIQIYNLRWRRSPLPTLIRCPRASAYRDSPHLLPMFAGSKERLRRATAWPGPALTFSWPGSEQKWRPTAVISIQQTDLSADYAVVDGDPAPTSRESQSGLLVTMRRSRGGQSDGRADGGVWSIGIPLYFFTIGLLSAICNLWLTGLCWYLWGLLIPEAP
jgi:hypothetical protein